MSDIENNTCGNSLILTTVTERITMKNSLNLLAWASVPLLLTGCALTGGSPNHGRAVFSSMQAAVSEASTTITPSITYVDIQAKGGGGGGLTFSGGRLVSSGGSDTVRSKKYAGLVADENGHIIIGTYLKAADVSRCAVWVEDEERKARFVQSDEAAGLTLLKVEDAEGLTPIDFTQNSDLVTGEWMVSVSPTGEDQDFEETVELGFCNAIEPGPVRTYRLKGVRLMTGAPVLNLDGELVAIAKTSTSAISLSDSAQDVKELLAKVSENKEDREDAGAKGWMGITQIPINPDYARKHDLPRGGILVNTVAEDSPAAKAGLQSGDLIVRVNGKDMRFSGNKAGSYFLSLLRPRVGSPFTLTVVRDGNEKALAGTYGKPPKAKELKSKALGTNVRNIDSTLALTQRLLTDNGVYVSAIDRGSPAAVSNNSGGTLLSKGDVITAINGSPTPDLESFGKALETIRKKESKVVLVAYARGKTTGFAALNLSLGDKK